MRSRAARTAALACALAVLLAAAVVLTHRFGGVGELRSFLETVGPWAPLVLFAGWLLGTPMLVPGTVLSAVAGLVLGPLGVVVSLVGSPLGALIAFGLARWMGGTYGARIPARVTRVVERLERSGPWGVALVRMAPALPVGPFNYACGLTQVRARDFVLGSALGAAPRVVLYGSLGGVAAALPFL